MTAETLSVPTEGSANHVSVIKPEFSRPSKVAEWTLTQIQEAISRRLPPKLLSTRRQGGQTIHYIPWHIAARILDKYAKGWEWEIRTIHTTSDRLFLVGRLSIPTAEGVIFREATGTEVLKELDKKTGELKELSYGDSSSNAESMAFRRAAAKFGLGLYLYDRD